MVEFILYLLSPGSLYDMLQPIECDRTDDSIPIPKLGFKRPGSPFLYLLAIQLPWWKHGLDYWVMRGHLERDSEE